jgi:homoserine O-acetyltransferase
MGWWDDCIGPGKAFDTDRFFRDLQQCDRQLLRLDRPGQHRPATGKPYGLHFPVVTIGDMVRAQVKLIDHLGIDKLLCVAGGSMGGMQVLEWAAHHPQRLHAVIPIATTAHHSPMLIAFSEVGRQAIYADPSLESRRLLRQAAEARRRPGRGAHGRPHHLSERRVDAPEVWAPAPGHGEVRLRVPDRVRGRELSQVQRADKFTQRFDANSYLYVTKAMDYFDLTQPTGSLAASLCRRHARQVPGDQLHQRLALSQLSQQAAGQRAHRRGADVTYLDVKSSSWGHDAFLLEVETMTNLLTSFLGRLVREERDRRAPVGYGARLLRPANNAPPRDQLADNLA